MNQTVPLEHKAFRPPRPTFIGENVFAQRWAEWMRCDAAPFRHQWEYGRDADDRWPIEIVLSELRYEIDQRAASMAASLVTWLGTNVGRSVLLEGDRIRKTGTVRLAYLVAWTLENQRHRSVNGGVQIVEYLLMTTWPRVTGSLHHLPEPKACDIEVCDHVMRWIGEDRGQAFVQSCRAEIEKRERAERDERLAKFESGER